MEGWLLYKRHLLTPVGLVKGVIDKGFFFL